ncbi:hypothetical protein KPH14_001547 [Odynerus spinipes]|uniref:Small ribosomal subunit protein uS7 domain-containing protein n=1 Tax=Odynerus spinipes TaxID=1348599 RepID=A0AAD9RUQ2_9HYME|nr:hypothetical protein KPH14_001547 [Odynerus spinipes]
MTSFRVTATKTINLFNLYGSQRCYSVFPERYIKPIYRKEEQHDLWKSPQVKEILYKFIKPAKTSDTCSEFYDANINLFTNYIMRKGKKNLAISLVQETFENIKRMQLMQYHKADPNLKDGIELDPKVIFYKAIENCTPVLELQVYRKGGIRYKVPVAIHDQRARFLAMNWLIQAAKSKDRTVHLPTQLAKEFINAFHNQGRVVAKKQDLHKECDANRAYAHFRWQKQ